MRMSPHRLRPQDASGLEGKGFDRAVIARVARFARPYRGTILLFLVLIIVAALLALVSPLVVREILDQAIPAKDRRQIGLLTGLAVFAALAEAAIQIGQRWCSARVGEGLIADLRSALFDRVERMPLAFFTQTPTGAITSRLNHDVVGAQSAVTTTLGSVVSNIVVLVSTFSLMIALEWRLTLLALFVLPLFIIPARRVGLRLQDISRQQMQDNAAMNTQMTERFNVAGALLVKLYGSYDLESAMFRRRAQAVRDAGVRQAMVGRVFFVALGLVAALGTAAIYGVGAFLVVDGRISSGTLVALALLVTRVYQPLTGLTNARVDLMTSLVSFERVFEVLDAPDPIHDKPAAIDLVDPQGRVEFRSVSFRYPPPDESAIVSMETKAIATTDGERQILSDIDLDIASGETVAVVGASGVGKSTLSSLIPRLYDVTDGSVRIDGHDVRDVTLESLRSAIGVVSQDPHLFHETIGENVAYARPGASQEEIVDACQRARIHATIEALPDGYDTVVGERGYRLSGGEKQRVAIARLLLKDPRIVILDEATSHLDNETEALVQESLEEAMHGRTALVIAHRLSTVRAADRLAVLHEGRIVELGNHDELVAANGVYAAQLRAGDM